MLASLSIHLLVLDYVHMAKFGSSSVVNLANVVIYQLCNVVSFPPYACHTMCLLARVALAQFAVQVQFDVGPLKMVLLRANMHSIVSTGLIIYA